MPRTKTWCMRMARLTFPGKSLVTIRSLTNTSRAYRLPVMHTETNFSGPGAVDWLQKEWANVHRLKQDGVPLIGFTWYSLQDQVDWDTGLRENNNRVNELGLVDLDRNIRPVGYAYQKLVETWRHTLPTESNVLSICGSD